MFVSEIWRYPVKSMGGERLESCELTVDCISGDRVVHVEDARGRVVTARSRSRLLLFRATLGSDGEPRVDGRLWRDEQVAGELREAAGDSARLVASGGSGRFDAFPLLIATDGAIAALGYDGRRFRPNLVIGGVEGFTERTWQGRRLALGDTLVHAIELCQRCIMTTFDPDTAEQDTSVLKRINRELEGTFALNCRIEKGGTIRQGDPVRLVG